MSIQVERVGRRAIAAGAAAGACIAVMLGLAADQAMAAYAANVQGRTLHIDGNGASDKLALRLAPGAPNMLQVDVGEDGTADFGFDRSTFTAIDVEGGGGDDEIRIDESGGALTDDAVTLNGGAGADTLIGGSGADVLDGGSGSDVVDGKRGADVGLLGAGRDRFTWDPGDGSDTVEGQAGADVLDSTVRTRPSGSTSRRTVRACACPATSRRSRWISTVSKALTWVRSAVRTRSRSTI
jgi:hypothetical protein